MSLKFKFIPLTFLSDEVQIKYQIKNTVILRFLFDKYNNVTRLKNLIIDTQYGYNASALKAGQNKFLRISDIKDGKVDWTNVPFCDCSDKETYLLDTDDLLVARTGGTTGKSFMISNPPENSVFAGYLIRMRANKQNNSEFINLFLNSYVYWSQIVSLNKGEFRPSVNATKLKNLVLPKVDVHIQNEVVKISYGEKIEGYSELYELIENTLSKYSQSKSIINQVIKQKEVSEKLKESILQEAIQGKLTQDWRNQNPNTEPASELLKHIKAKKAQLIKGKKIQKGKYLPTIEEEMPFNLPEGWVWCRINDLSENRTGNSINKRLKNTKYKKLTNGFNYIGTKDVPFSIGSINYKTGVKIPVSETEKNFKIAKKGSVFICIEGGSSGRKIGLVTEDVCFGNKLLASTPFIESISKYLYYLYYSSHFQNEFENQSKGLRGGVSVTNFKKIKVPLPPIEELKVIVEKVEVMMRKCVSLEQEITQSEAHANMLMQAVLKEAFESSPQKIET